MSIKLAFMLFISFLMIEVGIMGKLGSIIGAIIDPSNMTEIGTISTNTSESSGNHPKSIAASNDLIINQIASTFGSYAIQANQIMLAESSGNSNAYNPISVSGSHAEGLFQILYPSTWNSTSQKNNNPYDYVANIKAAYEIFQRDGYSWREWATAKGLGLV